MYEEDLATNAKAAELMGYTKQAAGDFEYWFFSGRRTDYCVCEPEGWQLQDGIIQWNPVNTIEHAFELVRALRLYKTYFMMVDDFVIDTESKLRRHAGTCASFFQYKDGEAVAVGRRTIMARDQEPRAITEAAIAAFDAIHGKKIKTGR